jgi:hypothetical protein
MAAVARAAGEAHRPGGPASGGVGGPLAATNHRAAQMATGSRLPAFMGARIGKENPAQGPVFFANA